MESKPRILIIDDEEVVRDSCAQILAGGAYELASASDGTAGLALAEEFHPDLIFVDLKMPGISGFEVLEKVAAMDATIVMVVITGFATISSAVDAMKKGAYDFLPKPFTPEEFRLITRRSLEKRKLTLETIALRREKEMLREHFAHIVSHELKSPLNAVQQNLMALEFEVGGALTEVQKDKLARTKNRIGDLIKLINAWLRAISMDAEQMKETFTQVSVKDEIAKALENVQPYAVRKDVEIITSICESLHPVLGDGLSLSEAFTNVIGNAVKYSRDGSKVTVKAEERESDVLISVKDEGIGIAAEDVPHIFEGFYRGKSGQAAASGHGIGLAVTRQIIEAHKGTITVESEPGKGTTFIVRLPKS
ncbi:MAG: hybrid sensor histidine kinase/response regulator [Chloroflexota bacterium]